MAERVTPPRRGSYGIDAPFAPAFLAGLVILYLVLAIVTGRAGFWLAVLFISAVEALFIHTVLRGKFVVWVELLDGLKLRGDKRILDLGCGRGAVLLMAAQHLTTGRAVVLSGIPEPSTLALAGLSGLGAWLLCRKP